MASDSHENGSLRKISEKKISVITGYNSKTHSNGGLAEVVVMKYKSQTAVPLSSANGSTLPLVPETDTDADAESSYNPFFHRRVAHSTTNFETLIHLLKGSLGTGILAMPMAFKNSGYVFGFFATFVIGFICTYCIHVLVECSHILCKRIKVPSLGFADVAETAFLTGAPSMRKYAGLARFIIDTFLVIDLLGCCCVYVVFTAKNLQQVLENYGWKQDISIWILYLLIPLVLLCLIKNLKFLAPFSMVANVMMGSAMAITFYYIFRDGTFSVRDKEPVAELKNWPLFFGTAIFALEGIGVVMPLENNMATPASFVGCPGVLTTGMTIVVALYTGFGLFGYLKYGDSVNASVTLDLPQDEVLAQSVKVIIAVAIFITYALQFYVPIEIIWKKIKHRFERRHSLYESLLRTSVVCCTVFVAAAVPDLGPIISLIGAVCLSVLGLIMPSIIEIITYHAETGSHSPRRIIKSILIIAFGILGFITGTYSSVKEIIDEHFGHIDKTE